MEPAAATTTTGTFPWWFHIHRDWVKSGKGMQQEWDTSTPQGFKHHQNITYGTQRQGHQTTEKWGNIQIQVPTN